MSDKKTKTKQGKTDKPAAGKSAGGKSGGSLLDKARAAAFTDESQGPAFAHFRPLAEKVKAADLPVFTGQPLLMRANIRAALEVMEPHLVTAAAKLVDARLQEVLELPAIVMALDFAVGRVPVARLSSGEIEKMLSEGAPWRELMLSFLEIASHPLIGLLPRERVARIRAGTGKLDSAQDFVALPGLLAEFSAALAGKHPFPADKLDLLATLGGVLVQNVRPGRAITEAPKRTSESILRDQLAALVTERYDHLQVLAAVALGKRKADELLPALRSAVAVGFSPTADKVAEPASPAAVPEKTPA